MSDKIITKRPNKENYRVLYKYYDDLEAWADNFELVVFKQNKSIIKGLDRIEKLIEKI